MDKYEAYEKFSDIEEVVSARWGENRYTKDKSGKKRKQIARPKLDELTDFSDNIVDWVPTCAATLDPQHHERQWLINSVAPFYQDNIITDVIRRIKGGKEANVYCCRAHPATGVELIAAKLYRPRILRTLKNDVIYKAGRQLRDEEGKQLKGRREKLALAKKTRFGKQLDMVWWIGNEFSSQKKLFDAGANVPRPIGHNGNTILMDYVGDERLPAPTLIDVALTVSEAKHLFTLIFDNINLMLKHHLIHGDLSPYNILYWKGTIQIIDFPQMVEARHNPNAYSILKRDIRRVCDYFTRLGVQSDPEEISASLWFPYMGAKD
jgi:RIO kinase 1